MGTLTSVVDQERALRARIRSIIGAEGIPAYCSLNLSYTFRDAVFIYFLLGFAIAITCYLHRRLGPTALVFAPLIATVTGVAFNWINVQIHEASHNLLLRDKRWNDLYCNLIVGAVALQDVETYRAIHGMHHAQLHTDADPDRELYSFSSRGFRPLLTGIAEDLGLITAIRRRRAVAEFIARNKAPFMGAPLYTLIAKIAAQVTVVTLFFFGCGIWGIAYYASCYLYGLAGIYPVLIRIRTVVQHHDELDTQDSRLPKAFVSRTTVSPILEFVLVGARMDYHFEHHLYPMIPYYNLRKIHDVLNKAEFFEALRMDTGLNLRTENYLETYAKLVL